MKLILKNIYMLIYWITASWAYKKLHVSSFISPFCETRNKRNLHIGPKCLLRFGSSVGGSNIRLEENVRLGKGSHIFGNVRIGKNVMIAPNVCIAGGSHGTRLNNIAMVFQEPPVVKPIIIEDDVWIGANSVILSGSHLKKGTVIGAGSVVKTITDENYIYAGNPCKPISKRI